MEQPKKQMVTAILPWNNPTQLGTVWNSLEQLERFWNSIF